MPENPQHKRIISGVMERKKSYFNSTSFGLWSNLSRSIDYAVNQRFQAGEQQTRSGFYLGTMIGMYESFIETANQVYREADPLFIHDSNRFQGGELAVKSQKFHNRLWENMGADNNGGMSQWLALVKDVPIYGMAVTHPRWVRRVGLTEVPAIVESAGGQMIDWQPEWNVLQDDPELMRIHPRNWFGEWTKADNLAWEGFIDEWTKADIAGLMMDDSFVDKAALQALSNDLSKGSTGTDPNFFNSNSDAKNYIDRRKAPITVYWGTLNHIKGLEKDNREYHVICDEKRIYKLEQNLMPGYRRLIRVRSAPYNDSPFGRAFLAPNLTHQRIMNLMVGLGIDDTIMRIHNGYAIWENHMVNPNDFTNPELNGIVRMNPDSRKDNLPARIGGESSGTFRDLMEMRNIINDDSQSVGLTDQRRGLQGQQETATGRLLLERADNRKVRNAILEMTDTGLIPAGKQIFMLGARNMVEQQRMNMTYRGENFDFTNEDIMQTWNNKDFTVHDAIIKDQQLEVEKLMRFFEITQGILTQDPNGLPKILNNIREIGRKMKVNGIENFLPDDQPVQVPGQVQGPAPAAGGVLSPPPTQGAALPPQEQLEAETL